MIFIDQNDKIELEKVLTNNLSKETGDELMTSLAQAWKEESIQVGKAEGEIEKAIFIAKNLLKEHASIEYVAKITRLSINEVNKLFNELT